MDERWQRILENVAGSLTPDKVSEAWKGFSQLGSSPPKTPDKLPTNSYTQWNDAGRSANAAAAQPFATQIYPKASDAGFNIPSSAYNMLAPIRQSPNTNPDAVYPPKYTQQDRLPYEDLTPPPSSRKGGRLDAEQPAAQGRPQQQPQATTDFISPEIRTVIQSMVKKDPTLLQRPWVLGKVVEKMLPFMHKVHQEAYQRQREEHTRRMEEHTQRMEGYKAHSQQLADERAGAAQRLEEYRVWHDQEKDITGRADRAFNRMLKVADPMTTVDGDRAAQVKRYRDEYEAAEEERKRLVASNPYLRKDGGAAAMVSGPGASYGKGSNAVEAAPEKQDFERTKTQYDKAMDKAASALSKASTQNERNIILRNTIDFANAARDKADLPHLTEEEVGGLVQSMPQYDTTTYGQMASNWFGKKMQQYFPSTYELLSDLQAGRADGANEEANAQTPWYAKDPFDPITIAKGLNPLALETQFSKGLRRAAGVDPTMKELAEGKSASWPERGMGALGAWGALMAPAATLAAPGSTIGGQAVGESVYDMTQNPYAALAAGGLTGAGLHGIGRGMPKPPAAPGQQALGGPSAPLGLPAPGLPYPPTMPSGSPAQAQRPLALPAPGQTSGPSRAGPLPGRVIGSGSTVRPRRGLYGNEAYQPPRGPAFEMGPPPAPPGPPQRPTQGPAQGPAAQASAAADVLEGKDPAPPARSLRDQAPISRDVSQFGDYAVGDKVTYRGKQRTIEELVPKQPGHLAPKVRLSGLKGPVTMTALEKAASSAGPVKPPLFSAGQDVKWLPGSAEMMRAMGVPVELQAGKIEQIVKMKSGDVARIRKPDGSLAEVRLRDLERAPKP